ncbi:hypothetical protein [Streptomyces antimycoticus]|uniref:hypothetical protein n=1 Tax=Streptomyces antimycoticus TaxID=68175 RepID=UPI0025710158|nr:hypothetical protein [Streptomyces antimycoticus]WJD99758.1 hypothetical protein QR300_29335 [Streptomyces antimycoticus]
MDKLDRYAFMTDKDIEAEITRLQAETRRSGAETSEPVREAGREAIDAGLDELRRRREND